MKVKKKHIIYTALPDINLDSWLSFSLSTPKKIDWQHCQCIGGWKEADAKAIRSDWEAVGKDISNSVKSFK